MLGIELNAYSIEELAEIEQVYKLNGGRIKEIMHDYQNGNRYVVTIEFPKERRWD